MMGERAKAKNILSRNKKPRWKKYISRNNKFKWPEHLRIEGKQNIAKCGLQETHQNDKTQED